MQLLKIYDQIGEYSVKNFPDAGPKQHMIKLAKEAIEASESGDVEEYADCLLALLAGVYRAQFTMPELLHAAERKLIKIRDLEWHRLDDGTYQHVPTDEELAKEKKSVPRPHLAILIRELASDKSPGSYYHSWQSNIAMAFQDAWDREMPVRGPRGGSRAIHQVSNEAAKNFLDQLIRI